MIPKKQGVGIKLALGVAATLFTLVFLGGFLAACGTATPAPKPTPTVTAEPQHLTEEEQPDCDLEDVFSLDEDCYGKKTETKKPTKETKKPAPRSNR